MVCDTAQGSPDHPTGTHKRIPPAPEPITTTGEGVRSFTEAGVAFGPGKAANAGGVAISGLEMTQNAIRMSWTRDEVDQRLQKIMADIHAKCVDHGSDGGGDGWVDYPKGANVAGFIKVADAMLAQGVV